jgi:hypothetical protein
MADLNNLGLLYLIHAALPTMKRQGTGHLTSSRPNWPLHPPSGGLFRDEARSQRDG